jgi:hypothetical protein
MEVKKEGVFLVLLLLISFFTIFDVHHSYTGEIRDFDATPSFVEVENLNYPYPIHADEWNHLARTIYLMEFGEFSEFGFMSTNPYSEEGYESKNYQFGYHNALFIFFSIFPLDPVLTYQYLPALFFVINSIFLFLFVRRFLGNDYVALLSIIFFLAIPSNINMLGNWFATPLTFSLFMVYLFFILFDKFMKEKEKKYLIYSLIVYSLIVITYLLAAMLIAVILFFYLFYELKIHRKMNPKILVSLLLLLFLFVVLCFKFIIFKTTWTTFKYDYSLIFFYGLFPTLLALFGFWVALKEKKNSILLIWPILCLVNLGLYAKFNFGFFIPYERTLYYFLVGLAPLAGLGCYSLLKLFYEKVGGYIKIKNIAFLLTLILFFVIMCLVFEGYYSMETRPLDLFHILGEPEYNALKFLEGNYEGKTYVFADSFVSIGVFPISKSYIASMETANLGYKKDNFNFIEFLLFDCEEKLEHLKEFNEGRTVNLDETQDFVLSGEKIDCEFLKEVYGEGTYLYEIEVD